MVAEDKKKRLAAFFGTMGAVGAILATTYVSMGQADTVEEYGLRRWLASVIALTAFWVTFCGSLGWLAGYIFGFLLTDDSAAWEKTLPRRRRHHRRHRRRRRSSPPRAHAARLIQAIRDPSRS